MDKKKNCEFFVKNGVCKHNENCKFFHPPEYKKENPVCTFYQKTGRCEKEGCVFSHPNRDLKDDRKKKITRGIEKKEKGKFKIVREISQTKKPKEEIKEKPNKKEYKKTNFTDNEIDYYLKSLDISKFIEKKYVDYQFEFLMKKDKLNLLYTGKVIDILSSKEVLESIFDSHINNVYSSFINGDFISLPLQIYIKNISSSNTKDINKVLTILIEAVKRFPDQRFKINTRFIEKAIEESNDEELMTELKYLKDIIDQVDISTIKKEGKKIEKKDYNINELDIYPNLQSLSEEKDVPSNKIQEKWSSAKEYIYTHFSLLHEDYMSVLREGYQKYLTNEKLSMRDLPVFNKVEVISLDLVRRDIGYKIKFQTNIPLKQFQTSKFLMEGSLVILFEEGELKKEPIIAIVVKREALMKKFEIVISPQRDLELNIKYIMMESPCYFRSIEPILKTLKQMSPKRIPFKEILIKGSKNMNPPLYIRQDPIMDISEILGEYGKPIDKKVELDVTSKWVGEKDTYLDPTQSKAIQHILNSEVSLVKGPPGTGKTFLGIRAVKLIEKHLRKSERQIVVICYTNHALDQFLEGISDTIKDFIRIGGRSKSDNNLIKENNLTTKLKKISYKGKNSDFGKLFRNMKENEQSLKSNWKKLEMIQKNDIEVVSLANIFCENLTYISDGNISMEVDINKAFELWITGGEKKYLKDHQKKSKSKKQNIYKSLEIEDEYDEKIDEIANDIHTGLLIIPDNQVVIQDANQEEFIEVKKKEKEISSEDSIEDQIIKEEIEEYLGEISDRESLFEDFEWEVLDSKFSFLDKAIFKYLDTSKETINKMNQIDPYTIPEKKRREIFQNFKDSFSDFYKKSIQELIEDTRFIFYQMDEYQNRDKLNILQRSRVIGLTSTGASIHKDLLNALGAPVYLIEEAGELLECQLLACLNPHIEHLIMIGDEQQLRPKVNSYTLEKEKQFAVSLFERLVIQNYPKETILTQLRMRPEISEVIRHFYPKLVDHERVKNFPNIEGINGNLIFMTHTIKEDTSSDNKTKRNTYEAQMVSNLAEYLSFQKSISENDITIITPYKGQQFEIKKLLKEKQKNIRAVTIDDYQGEENKIIILSLVRSNNDNNTGFVSIRNRIIVALSRAKYGLFVIGNSSLLEKKDTWYPIVRHFDEKNLIQSKISLFCPNHPKTGKEVQFPNDFKGINHGGCNKTCGFTYLCGHQCKRLCHPKDPKHEELKCQEKCPLNLSCGHNCLSICHFGSNCKTLCKVNVEITMPNCGHLQKKPCYLETNEIKCQSICGSILRCGHKCREKCHQACYCSEKVKAVCTDCKRSFTYECGSGKKKCNNLCDITLSCGHKCKGECGDCSQKDHPKCQEKCNKTLPCSHQCSGKHSCSDPCPPCKQKCMSSCSHVKCNKECSKTCTPCQKPCENSCPHSKCLKVCSEVCNRSPCNERCQNVLKCNHQCQGLCGERCPNCLICNSKEKKPWIDPITNQSYSKFGSKDLFYELECEHIVNVDSLDSWMKEKQNETFKCCPTCNQVLSNEPRYQGVIKRLRKKLDIIQK